MTPILSRTEFEATRALIELIAVLSHKVDFHAFIKTASIDRRCITTYDDITTWRQEIKEFSHVFHMAEILDTYRISIDRLDRVVGKPSATRDTSLKMTPEVAGETVRQLLSMLTSSPRPGPIETPQSEVPKL